MFGDLQITSDDKTAEPADNTAINASYKEPDQDLKLDMEPKADEDKDADVEEEPKPAVVEEVDNEQKDSRKSKVKFADGHTEEFTYEDELKAGQWRYKDSDYTNVNRADGLTHSKEWNKDNLGLHGLKQENEYDSARRNDGLHSEKIFDPKRNNGVESIRTY